MKPCKKCFHYNACITSNPDMVKKTFGCNFFEYKEKIKSALEKQIPKKPLILGKQYVGVARAGICKNCSMTENNSANYCRYCGQALDWGDSE